MFRPPWVLFNNTKPVITLKYLLWQHTWVIPRAALHLVIVRPHTMTFLQTESLDRVQAQELSYWHWGASKAQLVGTQQGWAGPAWQEWLISGLCFQHPQPRQVQQPVLMAEERKSPSTKQCPAQLLPFTLQHTRQPENHALFYTTTHFSSYWLYFKTSFCTALVTIHDTF